jgi:hypothetical protein
LREECRLRVFENRVLRRIFGLKRDEISWEWRRLHNKELLARYHLGDQVKKPEMGRICSTYWGQPRCIQGFSSGLQSLGSFMYSYCFT